MEIHTAHGEPIGEFICEGRALAGFIREICSGLTDKASDLLDSAFSC